MIWFQRLQNSGQTNKQINGGKVFLMTSFLKSNNKGMFFLSLKLYLSSIGNVNELIFFVFWTKLKFFTKAVTIFRDFSKHHTENTENCYILIDPKLKQNLYTTNFKSSFIKPLCNVLKHFMKAEGVLWTFSEALQNCLKRLILNDSLFGNIQNGLIFTWLILFLILWSNVLNS